MRRTSPLLSLCIVLASVASAGAARATPKFNPFTYPYDTLGEGEVEIEQYADVVPLKAQNAGTGAAQWYTGTQFQTEFEYGITNRLELGLYVSFAPGGPSGLTSTAELTEGTGVKQRLRYRFVDEGVWPIDVALYGEIVENDREIELEAKVILQKRFGRLRALVNLWAEREYYYANERDWVVNPTAAVSYQATPSIFPGIEGWMRVEWPDPAIHPRPFNVGPVEYLGPTMSFNFGRFWWTSGAYVRLNQPLRSLEPGDAYGNFWFRTIVGVEL
jgi:hypothetical protein